MKKPFSNAVKIGASQVSPIYPTRTLFEPAEAALEPESQPVNSVEAMQRSEATLATAFGPIGCMNGKAARLHRVLRADEISSLKITSAILIYPLLFGKFKVYIKRYLLGDGPAAALTPIYNPTFQNGARLNRSQSPIRGHWALSVSVSCFGRSQQARQNGILHRHPDDFPPRSVRCAPSRSSRRPTGQCQAHPFLW